jgi:hypothetical protein
MNLPLMRISGLTIGAVLLGLWYAKPGVYATNRTIAALWLPDR